MWSLWLDIKNLAVDLWRGITWFRKRPPAEEEKVEHLLEELRKPLEEELSRETDPEKKQVLEDRLEEVRAAQVGYIMRRLERTLDRAGLPAYESLVANGKRTLAPAIKEELRMLVKTVAELPPPAALLQVMQLMLSAQANYALGRYDEALADYNRALELKPDNPEILNNRGVTYDDLERYDEALADYNRALELRPDYAKALSNRGVVYTKLERYEDALADYNRSLELNPDAPEILNNRGVTYTKLERYEDALADFNHALELKPDHARSLYNMACLLSLMQRPEDAVAYLEKAIALDEKCRQKAATDSDFDNIRDDPRFRRLVEGA